MQAMQTFVLTASTLTAPVPTHSLHSTTAHLEYVFHRGSDYHFGPETKSKQKNSFLRLFAAACLLAGLEHAAPYSKAERSAGLTEKLTAR